MMGYLLENGRWFGVPYGLQERLILSNTRFSIQKAGIFWGSRFKIAYKQ